jgi:hypothetical protein
MTLLLQDATHAATSAIVGFWLLGNILTLSVNRFVFALRGSYNQLHWNEIGSHRGSSMYMTLRKADPLTSVYITFA